MNEFLENQFPYYYIIFILRKVQYLLDEFFFLLPYKEMDACLYGQKNAIPPESIARATGLAEEKIRLVYKQIAHRRLANEYLRLPPLIMEEK